jgi:hypothetical protein
VREQGDINALGEAYKRVGIAKGKTGGFSGAWLYFLKSMYVFAENGRGDCYCFDPEMLDAIRGFARPLQLDSPRRRWTPGSRKLRIAYLVFGAAQVESVILKLLATIGRYHNADNIEFAYFIPENECVSPECVPQLRSNIAKLLAVGSPVIVGDGDTQQGILIDIAHRIHDYSPDILVTSALLADLKHYFVVSMKPAPIVIGMTHGPPQQFSDAILDWSISWDSHALMDCMSGCSHVPLEVELPAQSLVTAVRDNFGLPREAVVLIAAGRHGKFIDPGWWQPLIEIMQDRHDVYFAIIGVSQHPDFLREMCSPGVLKRVKMFGWMENYESLLGIADIVLDTHPSGSGISLMDGMALGLPAVTFRNDYVKLFTQTDWSPGEWIVDIPELTAGHGDYAEFKEIVLRLITDGQYRKTMASLCKKNVYEKRGSPNRMVENIENIYKKVAGRLLDNADELPPPRLDIAVYDQEITKRMEFLASREVLLNSKRTIAKSPFERIKRKIYATLGKQ